MTVKDTEIAASRPPSLKVGLCYVHNDRHSVFIIPLHQTMEGVNRVPFHCSIASLDEFDRLDPRDCRAIVPSLLFVLGHL